MAVNFIKVYMFHPLLHHKLHIDYQFSNHFISLIEKITDQGIKGCYSSGDRYWNVKREIKQIPGGPYCAEIISDRNLVNEFRGFPVFGKRPLDVFGISTTFSNSLFSSYSLKLWKMSWFKLLKYTMRWR